MEWRWWTLLYKLICSVISGNWKAEFTGCIMTSEDVLSSARHKSQLATILEASNALNSCCTIRIFWTHWIKSTLNYQNCDHVIIINLKASLPMVSVNFHSQVPLQSRNAAHFVHALPLVLDFSILLDFPPKSCYSTFLILPSPPVTSCLQSHQACSQSFLPFVKLLLSVLHFIPPHLLIVLRWLCFALLKSVQSRLTSPSPIVNL